MDEIRSWLSPTEFDSEGSEYRKHLNAHVPTTGDWLFQAEQYKNWYASTDNDILWIKGIPGSGKSVIAANIIRTLAQDNNAPVLFFFCRRILVSNCDPQQIARDFLCQALSHSEDFPLVVRQVQDKYKNVAEAPFRELWKTLTAVLPTLPKVYLVVDALDEIAVDQDIFIDNLIQLGQGRPQSIKVVITSRHLSPEKGRKGLSILDLQLARRTIEKDIQTYITHRLNFQEQRVLTSEERSLVEELLGRKAQALFLYARLILDELLQQEDPIVSQLEQLPGSLADIYTSMLHEYSVRSGSSVGFQTSLLTWVTHSSRVLRLTELATILHLDRKCWGLVTLYEVKCMIHSSCGPLVEVLEDETVQVVHHSFTEFLLDTKRMGDGSPDGLSEGFPVLQSTSAHRSLASACVDYLASGCFDSWPVLGHQRHENRFDSLNKRRDLLMRFPFLQYASQNWPYHAAKCDSFEPQLFSRLDDFLNYGGHNFESWKDFWLSEEKNIPEGLEPLHIAAQSGLGAYVSHLLGRGADPNRLDSFQRSAMAYAADRGHSNVMFTLLHNGSEFNTFDHEGLTPLHQAAKNNHHSAVDCLCKAGADPMTPKSKEDLSWWDGATSTIGISPMQYACELGNTDCVVVLLRYVEPPRRKDIHLQWASITGQSQVLSVLLQYPEIACNLNRKDENSKTPLYTACCGRHAASVRVLLDHGADAHLNSEYRCKSGSRIKPLPSNQGLTPLQGWADIEKLGSQHDDEELEGCLELLVNAGCDVNVRNYAGETPLFAWGQQFLAGDQRLDKKLQFVTMLLKHGADPCARDKKGRTALHQIRSYDDCEEVISLLVQAGADINAADDDGETPLIFVAKAQRLDVGPLIRNGADPNIQDLDGNTALHYICSSWLLKYEHLQDWLTFADPTIKNNAGDTCIYNLRFGNNGQGRLDSIPFFIEKGLDLEFQNDQGRTVLHAAVQHGQFEFVQTLLRFGAKVDATDYRNKTVLHIAAENGYTMDIFSCLVKAGANVNAVDCDGNTPFHEACLSKIRTRAVHLDAVIKAGGVASAINNYGRTALHMAVSLEPTDRYDGTIEKVEFLLQQDKAIDLHSQDLKGVMAIHLAASVSASTTWHLSSTGADIQTRAFDGRTPLHFASAASESNTVGLICDIYRENGWSVDTRDRMGRTPLQEAARSGDFECVQFLLQAGANPNSRSNRGLTPLHAAAEHRPLKQEASHKSEITSQSDFPPGMKNLIPLYTDLEGAIQSLRVEPNHSITLEEEARVLHDVVLLLLSAGADPQSTNRDNETPYDMALVLGCETMVDILSSTSGQRSVTESARHSGIKLIQQWYLARIGAMRHITDHLSVDSTNAHSLLETAVNLKSSQAVKALLEAGADPTVPLTGGLTAIHTAAYWGLTTILKTMSSYVADINTLSPPLLHAAALRVHSNLQMIDLLIELGADVNAVFTEPKCPYGLPNPSYAVIHIFAAGREWWHVPALHCLLKAGADLELPDGTGRTPLLCALIGSRSGDSGNEGFWRDHTLAVLLEKGVNVNNMSSDGESTPLVIALQSRRGSSIIKKLIDHGASISLGNTPALCAAIRSGHFNATKAILDAGADPNVLYRPNREQWYEQSAEVETPLIAAASKDRHFDPGRTQTKDAIISLLLRYGADPSMELGDSQGCVLHIIASYAGYFGPLLKANLDLNIQDRQGHTPLMASLCTSSSSSRSMTFSLRRGLITTARELIEAGVDVNITDYRGSSPLHAAAASGFTEIVPLLLSHGASVLTRDDAGLTALCYVLRNGYYTNRLPMAKALLSAGADPLFAGPNGETALHLITPVLMLSSAPDMSEDPVDYFDEYTRLYRRFVDAGCDRNARDDAGNTPLFRYVEQVKDRSEYFTVHPPRLADIQDMFDQHDVFAVNNAGDTLLHAVTRRSHDGQYDYYEDGGSEGDAVVLFKELLARGLNPRQENHAGLSALDIATTYAKEGILELFERKDDQP
ncbi:uncharacterized protein KD926_003855 [Aspergillus affinis]|uniref:uncharacterized protein n=1 Tax=Aspergillus affinis TaxID=1070780 RepID=UPI0022FEA28C|nr:uncharacterized protein KD926_003855 [Aspergillus affinis]KAI9043325.1 hypothetical protein KD926_003855 [Aspergillus affinis]